MLNSKDTAEYIFSLLENQPKRISLHAIQQVHGLGYELVPYRWRTWRKQFMLDGGYFFCMQSADEAFRLLGFTNGKTFCEYMLSVGYHEAKAEFIQRAEKFINPARHILMQEYYND